MNPVTTTPTAPAPCDRWIARHPTERSTAEQLADVALQINANQYRVVHLAARYDDELDWWHQGHKSAAGWISAHLGIHAATAREWIRIGHALGHLPAIDAAFAANELSYAKVRILTRWADPDNEGELLEVAHERSADRLTTAIAKRLAERGETDDERDARLHESRSVTTWTDGDGMTIIRIALPPETAKPILAAVDGLVTHIARTPVHDNDAGADGAGADAAPGGTPHRDPAAAADAAATDGTPHREPVAGPTTERAQDAPADVLPPHSVAEPTTHRGRHAPADAFRGRSVAAEAAASRLPRTLAELRSRWQRTDTDDWLLPSLAQQRADAFVALFLGLGFDLTPEIVIHVRGDGNTFDDGTPITTNAVLRQLDHSFIRLLIHDTERRPINASHRRRSPTAAQRHVVMEAHGHECVDCQRTELLELDHDPPYHQTRRTVTHELVPRCEPCHHARHRHDATQARWRAA